MRRATTWLVVVGATLALAGRAHADPKPAAPTSPAKAPTPGPATKPTPPGPTTKLAPGPALSTSTEKPKGIWDDYCAGELVYVTNKNWRECCLLCSVGADSASPLEKAEAEKGNEKIVNNIFYSVNNARRSGSDEGEMSTRDNRDTTTADAGRGDKSAAGRGAGGNARSSKKDDGHSDGRARNRIGGLEGLHGL